MNQKTKDFVIIILGVVGLMILIKFIFGDWGGAALTTAFVFLIGYIIGRKNSD
jgi:membrane protein DedA with SNARE-associated domain